MLIFDEFPSLLTAEHFIQTVSAKYGLNGEFFLSNEAAYAADPRPFDCVPPVVHIERPETGNLQRDIAIESEITQLVSRFNGTFCGT